MVEITDEMLLKAVCAWHGVKGLAGADPRWIADQCDRMCPVLAAVAPLIVKAHEDQRRAAKREAMRQHRQADPERYRLKMKLDQDRKMAKEQARETGRPYEEVCKAWGIPVPRPYRRKA